MKHITSLRALLCTLLFSATVAYGQLKVESSGRILVGTFDTTWFDQHEILSMCIRGNNSATAFGGSKLAFGDFGRQEHMGWNVFIGEYDTIDTDKMWLHDKRGIMVSNLDGTVAAELGVARDNGTVYSNFKNQRLCQSAKPLLQRPEQARLQQDEQYVAPFATIN